MSAASPVWCPVHETSRYILLANTDKTRFLLTRTKDLEPLSWLEGEDAETMWRIYAQYQAAGQTLQEIDQLLLSQHDFIDAGTTLRQLNRRPRHR